MITRSNEKKTGGPKKVESGIFSGELATSRTDARSASAPLIGQVPQRPSLRSRRLPNDAASRTPRPHPRSLLNEFRGSRVPEFRRGARGYRLRMIAARAIL